MKEELQSEIASLREEISALCITKDEACEKVINSK